MKQCLKCGKDNPDDVVFCCYCGGSFANDEAAHETVTGAEAEPLPERVKAAPVKESFIGRIRDAMEDERDSVGSWLACFILGAIMSIPYLASVTQFIPEGSAWNGIVILGVPVVLFPVTVRIGSFGAAVLHWLNGKCKGLWVVGVVGYIFLFYLFVLLVAAIKGLFAK